MVDTLLSGLTPARVRLAIPKFRYESTIYIRDVLVKLGLVMTTSPTVANFTGINEEENVFLEEMFYRSSINVQETGLGDGDPVEILSFVSLVLSSERTTMILATVLLAVVGQLAYADQQQQVALSTASASFSQNLYQQVALDKPNVIYSPYSIHSALTMTSLGAKGDTASEMKSTLGITSLGDSVHLTYKELIQQMNSVTEVQLHTGNAIFVNPYYQINPKFIEDTTNDYSAKTANIDLAANGGPEKPINDYIAAQTEDMIKDVLQPGSIDGSTLMILVNTIFFNGTWEETFATYQTRSQSFNQLGGAVKQVDMMHDERSIKIKRDNANGVDVAELPFKGGRFSLYIALPQKVDGITDLEKLLAQPNKVNDLFTGLNYVRVQLAIPKFKTETKLTLNKPLKDMGMVKAFSPMAADFTGIVESSQLYISDVLHKAVIEVQETGTVAAAATVIGISFTAVLLPPSDTFIADHPFVYFLRDNQTGQILFQGKFSG
ncbi:leukocyte elastase inhibitor [Biomphalaria pfeifferi]|uniref:Leukocyte elastase inhibitor n=1 Tax=Biomphalaria pfeifferi TaxID=112525 RepID=A0AAD8AWZ4_BIOPF|nr:leukocyte elastase inhibitor [Biomphalaria pfeifferi]